MRSRHLRLTIRRSMTLVALVAALLAFAILPLSKEIARQKEQSRYDQIATEMVDAVAALELRTPQGVSSSVWVCTVRSTTVCLMNICFTWNRPSNDDLYRLRGDLMPRLRGPANLETLLWIWDRLARTGPYATRVVDRSRRSFEACIPGPGAKE
jgi:hypothetical protein